MSNRVGIGAFAGVGEESTFATAVAAAKYFELAPGDDKLVLEKAAIESAVISERGVDIANALPGAETVSGSLAFQLRYGGGWGIFYEHLLGNRFTTTGTGPYTHTITIGGTNSALSGKGLSIVVNRDGLLAAGSDKAYRYFGCRPTAIELTAEYGSIAKLETTIMGAGADYLTMPTASFSSTGWVQSPSVNSAPTSVIKFGTDGSESSYVARKASVKIEQAHEEVRDLAAVAMKEPGISDLIQVTGSFEVRFDGTGASGDPFTVAYRAQTGKSLLVTLDGASSAETLQFDLPDVLITSASEPHADAAGVLWQTIEWKAYRDGSATEGSIAVVNADTSIF